MRHIDDIDELVWQDLFDRESDIRKLKQEVEELKHDLSERDRIVADLRRRLEQKIALLGVP
jgi:predicted RNase H-like nuclease (RuvC/YqgF family)